MKLLLLLLLLLRRPSYQWLAIRGTQRHILDRGFARSAANIKAECFQGLRCIKIQADGMPLTIVSDIEFLTLTFGKGRVAIGGEENAACTGGGALQLKGQLIGPCRKFLSDPVDGDPRIIALTCK